MKRIKNKYEFFCSDGKGGVLRGITNGEFWSMHEALVSEINMRAYSIIWCGVYVEGERLVVKDEPAIK